MAAPKKPKTAPARKAKAEKRRSAAEAAGTLDDVRAKLWNAIERVDAIVQDQDVDPALVLKSTHALVQACGAYTKVLEVGELEARLAEIEAALEEQSDPEDQPLRRVK